MNQPKRVLVVGGGSAGWMAAAYLNAALNPGSFRRAEISLVESPDTPRIGVGEATVPSILHLLAVIGVDSGEFMKAVDATFKQSIRYVNWLNNTGEFYHHPFTRYSTAHQALAGELWLGSDRSIPFMETVSPQPIACELGLSPLSMDPKVPGPRLKYAYHMNALKFADYLTEFSTARGVTHHLEHVTDIEMAENGDIAAVKTKSGQRIEADLFIDCTGFAALLIEKKLGVGWVDCSQWLLCDQAVTMHVPYDHHYLGHVRPYTQATASATFIPARFRAPTRPNRSCELLKAHTRRTSARAWCLSRSVIGSRRGPGTVSRSVSPAASSSRWNPPGSISVTSRPLCWPSIFRATIITSRWHSA
jgi:tryptophan halogenase